MQIDDWKSLAGMAPAYRRLRKFGLEPCIAELAAFGFTIVPPDKIGMAPSQVDALAQALRHEAEEERRAPSRTSAQFNENVSIGRHGYALQVADLLRRQPMFIDVVMNEVVLTFAKYLMGQSCLLYTVAAFAKAGQAKPTSLHCDSRGMPPPLPFFSNVVNISLVLTDYRAETGTFCFVPGSHNFCRHPLEAEQPAFMGGSWDDAMCTPAIAPPGSLVIFPSNTWHGTYPKSDAGFRAHVAIAFRRNFMGARERLDDLDDALVARGGPEFERLIGRRSWQGAVEDHPEYAREVAAAEQSIHG